MSGKLAILLSDLHLGRGNAQDSFGRGADSNDATFDRFCTEISALAAGRGSELHFVLNGDVFDLWEIVRDELLDADAYDDIVDDLTPLSDAGAQRDRLSRNTVWQLDESLAAHQGFARGLGRILSTPNATVHLIYGNHDHALANPDVHAPLRDLLNQRIGSAVADAGNFTFGYNFRDTDVGLYAEHGDQFASHESRSPVDDGEREAPGYYALRFIYNRLEAVDHTLGASRPGLHDVILLILGLVLSRSTQRLAASAIRYLFDYFAAYEHFRQHHPPGFEMIEILLPLHRLWERLGKPRVPTERRAEEFRREAQARRWDDSASPPTVVGRRGPRADPEYDELAGLPGRREFLWTDSTPERLWQGIKGSYETRRDRFPKLEKRKDITAVTGHSHVEKYLILDNRDPEWTRRYINTGAWTRNNRLLYAWVSDHGELRKARGLRTYAT